jgi:hypothetical protein
MRPSFCTPRDWAPPIPAHRRPAAIRPPRFTGRERWSSPTRLAPAQAALPAPWNPRSFRPRPSGSFSHVLDNQDLRLIAVVVPDPHDAQHPASKWDRVASLPVRDNGLQRRRVRSCALRRLEPEQKPCPPVLLSAGPDGVASIPRSRNSVTSGGDRRGDAATPPIAYVSRSRPSRRPRRPALATEA